MSEKDRAAERAAAVAGAMDDIAKIDAHGRQHGGIDRAGLERIRERLLELAQRDDLFGDDDFPPPTYFDGVNRGSATMASVWGLSSLNPTVGLLSVSLGCGHPIE